MPSSGEIVISNLRSLSLPSGKWIVVPVAKFSSEMSAAQVFATALSRVMDKLEYVAAPNSYWTLTPYPFASEALLRFA